MSDATTGPDEPGALPPISWSSQGAEAAPAEEVGAASTPAPVAPGPDEPTSEAALETGPETGPEDLDEQEDDRRRVPLRLLGLLAILVAGVVGVVLLTGGDDDPPPSARAAARSERKSSPAPKRRAPQQSTTVTPTAAAPTPTQAPMVPRSGTSTGGGSPTGSATMPPPTAPPPTAPPPTAPPPTAPPGPTITSFTSSSMSFSCTTSSGPYTPPPPPPEAILSWTTVNAVAVDLAIDGPGVSASYGPQGSIVQYVPCDGSTHTYMLTAKSADGRTTSKTISIVTRMV